MTCIAVCFSCRVLPFRSAQTDGTPADACLFRHTGASSDLVVSAKVVVTPLDLSGCRNLIFWKQPDNCSDFKGKRFLVPWAIRLDRFVGNHYGASVCIGYNISARKGFAELHACHLRFSITSLQRCPRRHGHVPAYLSFVGSLVPCTD